MNHRNRRLRSLDPFLILTIIVGIGAVLTTTVQARSPDKVPEPLLINLPEKESQSWLSRVIADISAFVSTTEDDYVSAVGGSRPVVEQGLSWHLKAAPDEAAPANRLEPEVMFGVSYRW